MYDTKEVHEKYDHIKIEYFSDGKTKYIFRQNFNKKMNCEKYVNLWIMIFDNLAKFPEDFKKTVCVFVIKKNSFTRG